MYSDSDQNTIRLFFLSSEIFADVKKDLKLNIKKKKPSEKLFHSLQFKKPKHIL